MKKVLLALCVSGLATFAIASSFINMPTFVYQTGKGTGTMCENTLDCQKLLRECQSELKEKLAFINDNGTVFQVKECTYVQQLPDGYGFLSGSITFR